MNDVPSEAATAGVSMDAGQADRWGERLPRQIGLLNAIAVLVGVTIGSGIFRVPATVAAQLHDPGPVILCWVLGGAGARGGPSPIFAEYLGFFVPMTPTQVRYVAAGAIIVIGVINYIGVRR